MTHDRLEQLTDLVRSERGALAAVARSEGMSPEEALECVQDALSIFLRTRSDESSEGDYVVASLKTMIRNAARNARRKHSRLKQHQPIEVGSEPVADRLSVEELVSQAEDVVRLRLCVAELCEIQRAVVTLRLLEERSGEDVADILGVSRGYVDVLVHRARASLHICMRVP